MVDFDNETTVATPAKDVMKIYLLQCKAYTEDIWRLWRKGDFSGIDKGLHDVRASLEQWFIVMEPMIDRHWKDQEAKIKKENISDTISKGRKEDLFNLIIDFNRLLDNTKITRLDTRIITKNTWEASNLAHGF